MSERLLRFARCTAVTVLVFAAVRPVSRARTIDDSPAQSLKHLSLDELMDIEVTSVSKRPEKLLEAASAIQVITNEDIRRSGVVLLADTLRLADNLDVAHRSSHEWAISARGFNTELANKLLVLMDGRSVYTPLFSGVFWDIQDYLLEDIDRIEVISGPGGTLWGANAVNGVINITSKEARYTQGFYSEVAAGDLLRGLAAARYGGQLAPNVYFRVYGKIFNRDDEVTMSGANAHDGWSKRQAGFRIDADPSSLDALTLQGDLYSGDEDLVPGGDAHISGGNILGRWAHAISSASEVSLQVYFDRSLYRFNVAPLLFAPAGNATDDLRTYDIDLQHHLSLANRHQVVWGVGARLIRDVFGNAPALALLPERMTQHLFSGFAQDEIALPHDFVLTLGSKIEHNDYTGVEVEPSIRLQWNASPRHTFWTAVSRAVRTPSRIDREISQPAPAYTIVLLSGSDKFTSESLTAFEGGWRSQLASNVSLSLSLFANCYDDIRSLSPSQPDPVFGLPFPLYFENNLEGETYGAEFSASYQPVPWCRLHVGYNILSEDIRVKSGRTDINNALNEVADPGQQATLRAAFDLPHRWQFDVQARWVDSRTINDNGAAALVPSYSEIDARLGWRLNESTEFSLVGQNLLQPRHLEYGVPAPGRAEIGRSLYGKVTWQF